MTNRIIRCPCGGFPTKKERTGRNENISKGNLAANAVDRITPILEDRKCSVTLVCNGASCAHKDAQQARILVA